MLWFVSDVMFIISPVMILLPLSLTRPDHHTAVSKHWSQQNKVDTKIKLLNSNLKSQFYVQSKYFSISRKYYCSSVWGWVKPIQDRSPAQRYILAVNTEKEMLRRMTWYNYLSDSSWNVYMTGSPTCGRVVSDWFHFTDNYGWYYCNVEAAWRRALTSDWISSMWSSVHSPITPHTTPPTTW